MQWFFLEACSDGERSREQGWWLGLMNLVLMFFKLGEDEIWRVSQPHSLGGIWKGVEGRGLTYINNFIANYTLLMSIYV